MKVSFLRWTNREQISTIPFAWRSESKEIWTSLLKCGVEILGFAATAMLLGCAGLSTSNETVTGGSKATSPHTVELFWNASTSKDVRGYNLYRATYTDSCGSFSRINAGLITNTWFTDSEVTNGASYCYATTAVSTSNAESGYSNIVSDVRIPTS